jgi:hypothetical protein
MPGRHTVEEPRILGLDSDMRAVSREFVRQMVECS